MVHPYGLVQDGGGEDIGWYLLWYSLRTYKGIVFDEYRVVVHACTTIDDDLAHSPTVRSTG